MHMGNEQAIDSSLDSRFNKSKRSVNLGGKGSIDHCVLSGDSSSQVLYRCEVNCFHASTVTLNLRSSNASRAREPTFPLP